MQYRTIDCPIGRLLVACDTDGLRFLLFGNGRREVKPDPAWEPDRGLLKEPVRQLTLYFQGKLRDFTLAVAPAGTVFQRSVWGQLQKIPYGETISYGELARRLGNPKAVRAVGLANGSNPISIVIPCHRVIGSNGALVGYGGGNTSEEAALTAFEGQ